MPSPTSRDMHWSPGLDRVRPGTMERRVPNPGPALRCLDLAFPGRAPCASGCAAEHTHPVPGATARTRTTPDDGDQRRGTAPAVEQRRTTVEGSSNSKHRIRTTWMPTSRGMQRVRAAPCLRMRQRSKATRCAARLPKTPSRTSRATGCAAAPFRRPSPTSRASMRGKATEGNDPEVESDVEGHGMRGRAVPDDQDQESDVEGTGLRSNGIGRARGRGARSASKAVESDEPEVEGHLAKDRPGRPSRR